MTDTSLVRQTQPQTKGLQEMLTFEQIDTLDFDEEIDGELPDETGTYGLWLEGEGQFKNVFVMEILIRDEFGSLYAIERYRYETVEEVWAAAKAMGVAW